MCVLFANRSTADEINTTVGAQRRIAKNWRLIKISQVAGCWRGDWLHINYLYRRSECQIFANTRARWERDASTKQVSLSLCSANARVISAADAPSECALIRLQSHIKRDTRYGFSSTVPVCESGPHACSHCWNTQREILRKHTQLWLLHE